MLKQNRTIVFPIFSYTLAIVLPVFVWFFFLSGCRNDVVMVSSPGVNGSSTKWIDLNPAEAKHSPIQVSSVQATTTIRFDIPNDGFVTFTICDSRDIIVVNLLDREFLKSGSYECEFDATNCATGVYVYSLIVESRTSTGKPGSVLYKSSREMILVK